MPEPWADHKIAGLRKLKGHDLYVVWCDCGWSDGTQETPEASRRLHQAHWQRTNNGSPEAGR